MSLRLQRMGLDETPAALRLFDTFYANYSVPSTRDVWRAISAKLQANNPTCLGCHGADLVEGHDSILPLPTADRVTSTTASTGVGKTIFCSRCGFRLTRVTNRVNVPGVVPTSPMYFCTIPFDPVVESPDYEVDEEPTTPTTQTRPLGDEDGDFLYLTGNDGTDDDDDDDTEIRRTYDED